MEESSARPNEDDDYLYVPLAFVSGFVIGPKPAPSAPPLQLPQSVTEALAEPVPLDGPFDSSSGAPMTFELEMAAVERWKRLQVKHIAI